MYRIPLDKGPYMEEHVKNAFVSAVKACGWTDRGDDEWCKIEAVIEFYRFEKGLFRKEDLVRLKHGYVATFLRLEGGGKTLHVELYPILTEKDECSEVLLSLSLMGEPISPEQSEEFTHFWKKFLKQLPPF